MPEVELTDANFRSEVLESDVPVLVDFWAPWCGPCRLVAPVVQELASEYAGRLKVGKLNVDDNQATAQLYGVMSIPMLIVFKEGRPAEKMIGAVSRGTLERALEPHLSPV